MTERDVLMAARSDWLVRLMYAFQDPAYVYLAMVRTRPTGVDGRRCKAHG